MRSCQGSLGTGSGCIKPGGLQVLVLCILTHVALVDDVIHDFFEAVPGKVVLHSLVGGGDSRMDTHNAGIECAGQLGLEGGVCSDP